MCRIAVCSSVVMRIACTVQAAFSTEEVLWAASVGGSCPLSCCGQLGGPCKLVLPAHGLLKCSGQRVCRYNCAPAGAAH